MTTRKALIVGATGLVGGFCLQALLDDDNYSEVITLVRKPLLKTHRKLKTVVTTFDNLEPELSNIQVDDVYCCLGTTIKKAGSQEAFKKVDHTLVVTVAGLMKKQVLHNSWLSLLWVPIKIHRCLQSGQRGDGGCFARVGVSMFTYHPPIATTGTTRKISSW